MSIKPIFIQIGEKFNLRKEHISLIRRLNWTWVESDQILDETGLLMLDPKRPFITNRPEPIEQPVLEDIIDILAEDGTYMYKREICPDCQCVVNHDKLLDQAKVLYSELQQAIEIVCSTLSSLSSVQLGYYEKKQIPDYKGDMIIHYQYVGYDGI